MLTNERNAADELARKQGTFGLPFSACDGFRINSFYERDLEVESNDEKYKILVKYVGLNYEIKINDGEWIPFTVKPVQDSNSNRFTLKLNLDGVESIFSAVIRDHIIDIFNEVSTKLSNFCR